MSTNVNRLSKAIAALAVLTATTTAGVVHAQQQVCFPEAIPLPLLGGPPQWYTGPSGTTVRTDLNEPRWGASVPTAFFDDRGNMATNEGAFRIIRNGTDLHITIQNRVDSVPDFRDAVSFSVYSKNSNRIHGVTIPVNPAAGAALSRSTANVGTVQATGEVANPSGADWSSTLGVPSWIKEGSIATFVPRNAPVQPAEDEGVRWAIQFVVELGELGIGLDDDFRIFMAMAQNVPDKPGDDVIVSVPAMERGTSLPDIYATANTALWLATDATDPRLLMPKLRAACPAGIAFTSSLQIGTTNADDSTVNTKQANCRNALNAPVPCNNTFFARPELNGVALTANQLEARFRIANWGAQAADPFVNIPGGGAVRNTANGQFQFTCGTNGDGRFCGNASSTPAGMLIPPDPHQCMTVEIKRVGTNNVNIRTPIVYRNMRFESLSTKVLPAQISTQGLAAKLGAAANREIVMQVVTHNMPGIGNLPMFLDFNLLNWLKQLAVNLVTALNPFGRSLSPDDQMKIAWPTMEVHTYYDTKKTWTRRGVTYRVYSPMNSYGYHFSHDGVFFGYTHALGGTGVSRTNDNSNVYTMRMNDEAVSTVTTGVRTEDLPAFMTNTVNLACRVFPFCAPVYE